MTPRREAARAEVNENERVQERRERVNRRNEGTRDDGRSWLMRETVRRRRCPAEKVSEKVSDSRTSEEVFTENRGDAPDQEDIGGGLDREESVRRRTSERLEEKVFESGR